jgi:predicted transposase YbfD/YdcC
MLHSAQASEQSLALAQEIVPAREVIEEKSSEITAIPKVLDTLQSDGTLVTIGAMGRETDTAEEILKEKADDLLALKANRKTAYRAAQAHSRLGPF